MSLANARALSRKVGIKSKAEFLRWHRGQLKHQIKCPADMPMRPERVYPKEFKGWPDFLGSTATTWMTLDEAKDFVRAIGIKNQNEYREWVAGRLRRPGLPARPKNLPTNPDRILFGCLEGVQRFSRNSHAEKRSGVHGGRWRQQENMFGHSNWRASTNIGSGQEEN